MNPSLKPVAGERELITMKAYKITTGKVSMIVSKNVGTTKDARDYLATYLNMVGSTYNYDEKMIRDLVEFAYIDILSQDEYDAIYGRGTVERGMRIAVKKLIKFLKDHFW